MVETEDAPNTTDKNRSEANVTELKVDKGTEFDQDMKFAAMQLAGANYSSLDSSAQEGSVASSHGNEQELD